MRWLKLIASCFVCLLAAFATGAAVRFGIIFSDYPSIWPLPNAIDVCVMGLVSLILFIVASLWLKRLI